MPKLRAYVWREVLAIAFCSMLPGVAAAKNPRELTA